MSQVVFVLFMWVAAEPDPYRVEIYETMNACRYDLPKTIEWAEREQQTHIVVGCRAMPLAPVTSIRPEARS